MAILAMAGSFQACTAKQDIKAGCETEVREELLNPETAEFFDFQIVDAETFKVATVPSTEGNPAYSASHTIAKVRQNEIDSAAKLYRMRVRAEGQLGNTVTKLAFCRQPVEGVNACFCTLVD